MSTIDIAHIVCAYYENPNSVGRQDELKKVGLYNIFKCGVDIIRNADPKEFFHNERWSGIPSEIESWLPGVIVTDNDGAISKVGDVLNSVIVESNDFTIITNNIKWFSGKYGGLNCITSGLPHRYLSNCVTTVKPVGKITSVQTFLPNHIYKALKRMPQIIINSQGIEYYITNCKLESL